MAHPSFAQSLYKNIERAEAISLLTLIGGAVAHSMEVRISLTLIMAALAVLAAVYFLMAFRPPTPGAEPGNPGMASLINQTILPKILWISCAIGACGVLLYHTQPDNEGYKYLLLLHSLITVLGLLMVGMMTAGGTQDVRRLMPIFFRALPLMLVSAYILLQ